MALNIKNAVLHILRNDGRPSIFSETELDIDSETCETFITKHVKRLIDNPAARTACFKADAEIYRLLQEYQSGNAYFKTTAETIARKLDEIMSSRSTLPPCDLLIARVGNKSGEHIAILKLYCQEVYAHALKEEGADNQIIKKMILPFTSGKVEYAALITLNGDSMPISLLEKPAVIDGEALMYFSEMFLDCEASPSKKEQAQVIDEINDEFVEEYYGRDPAVTARIKTALIDEAETEEGFISMDNVASRAFSENEDLRTQYVEVMKDAGIQGELPLGERFTRQHFGTLRIKAENGVEVKFPAELAADSDVMEITRHSDGTVSVLLKNLVT